MGRTNKRPVVYFCLSFILRMLLIAASAISAVTMATSNEDWYDLGIDDSGYISDSVKFTDAFSFVYFVAAFSVAGFYGIITELSTCVLICLAPSSSIMFVIFAFFDVLIMGIVASATGIAGSVAVSMVTGEIIYAYSRLWRHLGVALVFALFASLLLLFLVWTSLISLYKRIPKQTFETSQPIAHPPQALTSLQTPPQAQEGTAETYAHNT